MTIIKKDKKSSSQDLVSAVNELIPLLLNQHEDEAVEALKVAAGKLKKSNPGDPAHNEAVSTILDAFEGEHELMAYTFQREQNDGWTEADELSQASYKVLNLARRINKQ